MNSALPDEEKDECGCLCMWKLRGHAMAFGLRLSKTWVGLLSGFYSCTGERCKLLNFNQISSPNFMVHSVWNGGDCTQITFPGDGTISNWQIKEVF